MTSYIPSLTLPSQVFAEPAVSILLPIVLGSGIGYVVSRKLVAVNSAHTLTHCTCLHSARQKSQNKYLALKQPPYRPSPKIFGPVWTTLYGLMGYSAYRAWTIGTASLNPQTVALAKVCQWLVSLG